MPNIRPVSHLQRKLGEVTQLALETGEPVYLTKNGMEHLVLIDAKVFERLEKKMEKKARKVDGRANS